MPLVGVGVVNRFKSIVVQITSNDGSVTLDPSIGEGTVDLSAVGSSHGPIGGSYLGDSLTTAQTITLIEYAAYGFTINSLQGLGTVSGTVTGTLNINGVPVGGISGLSLNSIPQAPNATSANVVAAGNTITFVTSSPSSLGGLLPFTLLGTK